MGWDFGFSSMFSGIDAAAVARSASAKAVALLGATTVETMRCPVVLDNHVATEILEVLSASFLADNVQKGKSMLTGRMGRKLFSDCLSIIDDGTLPGGMATAPFDGEGVAHQRTPVVEGGELKAFLYDSFSAAKDGVGSTGNASRGGMKSLPHAGLTNFFIRNGATPSSDLVKSLRRGLLLTDVMGMHTANSISGDFSVGAAGFLVENGEICRPVKGIAISGNILDLFRDVEMIGDDLRFFGDVGSPSLRIASLDVSGG
jgi:PmbA protein